MEVLDIYRAAKKGRTIVPNSPSVSQPSPFSLLASLAPTPPPRAKHWWISRRFLPRLCQNRCFLFSVPTEKEVNKVDNRDFLLHFCGSDILYRNASRQSYWGLRDKAWHMTCRSSWSIFCCILPVYEMQILGFTHRQYHCSTELLSLKSHLLLEIQMQHRHRERSSKNLGLPSAPFKGRGRNVRLDRFHKYESSCYWSKIYTPWGRWRYLVRRKREIVC